jgi:cysteinyl-tRNA synthetase
MAIQILGPTIDLHVGGVDNIFPHHENEIAQSEAFSNKLFSHFWMHSEHLLVEGKKMAKSAGNFYTLRDILHKGYAPKEVRYMLMHTHYRTQLNFTFEGMKGAQNALRRINDFILRIHEKADAHGEPSYVAHALLQKSIDRFSESLADDLNISEALAALFDLMHQINTLDDAQQINGGDAREILFVLREFDRVLNVMQFEIEENVPEEIQALLRAREEARKAKEWSRSDQLRDQLLAQGYAIEDTPSGPRLKKYSKL